MYEDCLKKRKFLLTSNDVSSILLCYIFLVGVFLYTSFMLLLLPCALSRRLICSLTTILKNRRIKKILK